MRCKNIIGAVVLLQLVLCIKVFSIEVEVYALEAMPYCGIVDGKPAGIAIDVLSEATNYGAPTFKFNFDVSWRRAQRTIQNSKNKLVAIIPFSRVEKREKEYKWIVELFPTISRFYSYRRFQPVMSIDEAKELTIGVVKGHAIISRLKDLGVNNLDEGAADAGMNASKLFRKRFDALADSDLISIYNWKKIGGNMEELQEGAAIGDVTRVFIAANLNFPEDVASSIYEAVEKMRKDGTYQRIMQEWRN